MSGQAVASTADDHFDGPWWRYPILRMALLSGALTGAGFALAHGGWIGERTEIAFYLVAIPVGAYHWAREALEELVRERSIGIDLLMLTAAAGSRRSGSGTRPPSSASSTPRPKGSRSTRTRARARRSGRSSISR